ncbi:unnamed protein product [Miscanthus lutarioriparius]|uniref:RNase H type-1 domain-containing protein n=1 Tax=Miscanthus lutarioriparius TaxID=422564 RepID=A0A811QW62_9POAL|nr:unnamed protein product [Miscanthus lutarioriparius]
MVQQDGGVVRRTINGAPIRTLWKPPPEGLSKCNTDGAFCPGVNQGATGVVLQDSLGNFEGGKACWYPHGLDALMRETLACRDGVKFAMEKSVQRLQIETDSQELVRLWASGDFQRSFLAPILKEIRDVSSGFLDFMLICTNRACNRVAHVLAKQVTDEIRLGEWQSAPTCIQRLLTEDCNPPIP